MASLTVRMELEGFRETIAAFRELPKDANDKLRDGTLELSEQLAGRIRADARGDSAQSALMAPTVKARRDRVPLVQAGGSRRVGRNRVPAYKVLFGSLFGAENYPQFRPWLGPPHSYWFFETVDDAGPEIARHWRGIADEIISEWARE